MLEKFYVFLFKNKIVFFFFFFFFSVVKMRPMGLYHVWHNIDPIGRKEEIKGRRMRGKNIQVYCVLGVEVAVSS